MDGVLQVVSSWWKTGWFGISKFNREKLARCHQNVFALLQIIFFYDTAKCNLNIKAEGENSHQRKLNPSSKPSRKRLRWSWRLKRPTSTKGVLWLQSYQIQRRQIVKSMSVLHCSGCMLTSEFTGDATEINTDSKYFLRRCCYKADTTMQYPCEPGNLIQKSEPTRAWHLLMGKLMCQPRKKIQSASEFW